MRGVRDDGRILNIAGDYIAHGIRRRASELMTLELGPQTEVELQNKLRYEVDADRLTRLDRMRAVFRRVSAALIAFSRAFPVRPSSEMRCISARSSRSARRTAILSAYSMLPRITFSKSSASWA